MNTNKRRGLGYGAGFIIALSILIIGFIVEGITGKAVMFPGWPYNLIILLAFIAYLFILHYYAKHSFVKWLSTPVAAISSISIFTLLVLMMGFIIQDNPDASGFVHRIGLDHIKNSWAFFLSSLYLMVILGLTTIRRTKSFTIKNIAFFLNHGGLWILIATASLGSSDLWKLSMPLEEGSITSTAYKGRENAFQMPFSIELIDFDIDVYPPQLGIMKNSDGRLKINKGDKFFEVEQDATGSLNDWEVHVIKYYETALNFEKSYIGSDKVGSAPAALIAVIGENSRDTTYGWVSCGSYAVKSSFLLLNSEYSVAMLDPTPEKYSSVIRIYDDLNNYEELTVEVNKPISYKGWEIYQVGYDEEKGRWSTVSILELVKDPWLIVVYIGIFMILAGSLYLVWMGRSTKFKKR